MEDAYGDIPDELNAGIPSDRFLVEWRIKKPKRSRIEVHTEETDTAIQTGFQNDFLVPEQIDLDCSSPAIIVPVPGNFQSLKQEEISLALAWREATRKVFSHYLSQGWVVTDLLKNPQQQDLYHYLMEKQSQGVSTYGN